MPLDICPVCGAKVPIDNLKVRVDHMKSHGQDFSYLIGEDEVKQHLSKGHELESITYGKPDDYSDGAPPMDVIHCASCSEDLAVEENKEVDLSPWFKPGQILPTQIFAELCSLIEK